MSALRIDLPIVPDATAAHDGYGARRPAGGVQARVGCGDQRQGPDRRARRRVRRPDDRVGPEHVPRVLRLPPCTTANGCFKKVNQDGEQGSYPIANPDWEPEIALDTEMVSAICPNCHILLVEANSADETIAMSNPVQHSDLGAAVDTAVNLGATEVSNSYGSRPGRSPTRPSSTTTTTIPASRSPRRPATRTTGRSGPPRRRT